MLLWLSLGGTGIFMILFAMDFLSLKVKQPIVYKALQVGVVLFILQTLLGVFRLIIYANKVAYFSGFVVPLCIIGTTAWIYWRGAREVRYYLIGWGALFTATLIWSTSSVAEAQIPASYFFLIGTTVDSLLFTLAIYDRIRIELADKEALIEREQYYQRLSRTDPMTGLYNRSGLTETFRRMEEEGQITPGSALLILDIDHFKEVNDTWGHLAGDELIVKAGTHIRKHIRKSDIACRYGGDEFLVYLPGADIRIARSIAQGIGTDIQNDPGRTEDGSEIRVTVSIGITEHRNGDSFDSLFLRADAALYQAKKTGRNKIITL
jgi:diguanylate cyclase (GGDEF)-like protein